MILDLPPQLILPDYYQEKRPAIIRPGDDLARCFPVDFDQAAIPFGMFKGEGRLFAYLSTAVSASDLATYTFSAFNVGTLAQGDRLYIAVASGGNAVRPINSVTVGGNAATLCVKEDGTNSGRCGIWTIAASALTGTQNIVVTHSNTTTRCGVSVWRAKGYSGTVTDSAVDQQATSGSLTAACDVPAGGILLATSYESDPGTTTPSFIAGVTTRVAQDMDTSDFIVSGDYTASAAETGRTVTLASQASRSHSAMVCCSFATI